MINKALLMFGVLSAATLAAPLSASAAPYGPAPEVASSDFPKVEKAWYYYHPYRRYHRHYYYRPYYYNRYYY